MNSDRNFNADADDVEALLRAAQDDVLLKLSINSHIAKTPASSSSSSLHPDLDSRLQALKSHKSNANLDANSGKKNPDKVEENPEKVENIDDLYSRFAALRGSIPAQSNEVGFGEEKGEEGDEVEQVIRWAIDAARLDPSPPSDEGEDDDDDDEDDSDDDGVDHKVDAAKRKSKK